jgi:hypothetical protein
MKHIRSEFLFGVLALTAACRESSSSHAHDAHDATLDSPRETSPEAAVGQADGAVDSADVMAPADIAIAALDAASDSPADSSVDASVAPADGALSDTEVADAATTTDSLAIAGEAGVEVARIYLSESTNTPWVQVIVYADASAVRTVGPPKAGWLVLADGAVVPRGALPWTFEAGSPEIIKFIQDLAAAGDVSAIPIGSCMKSVSFGTTTHLSAGGKQSGDLQCATNVTPAQAALIGDCQALSL